MGCYAFYYYINTKLWNDAGLSQIDVNVASTL